MQAIAARFPHVRPVLESPAVILVRCISDFQQPCANPCLASLYGILILHALAVQLGELELP